MLRESQPCILTGLLNLVCFAYFGAPKSLETWFAEGEGTGRTVARQREIERTLILWKRAGLSGHRRWLRYLVREGRAPPWAGAMVDQVGKVMDENLIKATSVVEFLYEEEMLVPLAV